jgi:death on curing protein
MSDYLTLSEVLAIHADQIERYGGSPGIRDRDLLESAVLRPQNGYYADLREEAAAVWEGLSQNHRFVDGNKRTAFAAAYTFLAINGLDIATDVEATYDFLIDLYENDQFRFEYLLAWLRSHTTRR